MKTVIQLMPVKQTGHNCKPTAIAAVDYYFSNQLKFQPVPLHKNKTALTSIRKLSKKYQSCQGELLEFRQLSDIFTDLGYETQVVDFRNNYELFKSSVISNIKQNNLIIACFAVDRTTGFPLNEYQQDNEHAAIIHGIDEDTEGLYVTHWDKNRKTTMQNFYNSSMVLPDQRAPEYYVKVKKTNKQKKYDLYHDQTGKNLPKKYKQSLVPALNSGFRGKLLVINSPDLQKTREARKKIGLFDSRIKRYMMAHHKLFMGIGFTLVLLGLVAAAAGILGLMAGLWVLSTVMATGLAVIGGTVGIGLCVVGGGILAGMGVYGRSEKK